MTDHSGSDHGLPPTLGSAESPLRRASAPDPSRPGADPRGSGASAAPRPQFGEYATPEEQSRRAGRPLPPPVVHTPAPAVAAGMPRAEAAAAGDAAESRPAHPADRMATIALLAYGLWNVISSITAFLNPSSLMATMLEALGVSATFSNYGQAKVWGVAAAVVLIVGWIATAFLAVLRLRSGKLAWWIPLVGGVVFVTVASICMMVPFFTDPAVASFLNGQLQK